MRYLVKKPFNCSGCGEKIDKGEWAYETVPECDDERHLICEKCNEKAAKVRDPCVRG